MKFQRLLLLRMRVKAFLEKIIVTRTSLCLVCPTISYYFKEDLNVEAGSHVSPRMEK